MVRNGWLLKLHTSLVISHYRDQGVVHPSLYLDIRYVGSKAFYSNLIYAPTCISLCEIVKFAQMRQVFSKKHVLRYQKHVISLILHWNRILCINTFHLSYHTCIYDYSNRISFFCLKRVGGHF